MLFVYDIVWVFFCLFFLQKDILLFKKSQISSIIYFMYYFLLILLNVISLKSVSNYEAGYNYIN